MKYSLFRKSLPGVFAVALGLSTVWAEVGSPYYGTYDYPEQPGLDKLIEADPNKSLLTNKDSGPTGPQNIFGAWDVKNLSIDWSFDELLKFSGMEVVITHPAPDLPQSHPDRVQIYVGDDLNGEPVAEIEIPFEPGPIQKVYVEFSTPIVAKKLRTQFITDHHQIALSEVTFDAQPAGNAQPTKKKALVPTESYREVAFLPSPVLPGRARAAIPFFGVCGHLMHTDFFFPGKAGTVDGAPRPAYWSQEYTLPLLQQSSIQTVRESLYQPFFVGDKPFAGGNNRSAAENRAHVEKCLSRYDEAGISVLLAPMFGKKSDPERADFARWIGLLTKNHPSITAIELHNEPNLKGFWDGSVEEFVASARAFAKGIREVAPDARLVMGSFSGWGGAWEHENLKELVEGPKEIAQIWAEKAFEQGLLKFADGISAHPYRGGSAPEGGDVLQDRLDPEGYEKEVRDWLALGRSKTPDNKSLPFYITEIGYSVSKEGYSKVESEIRQADYLTRQVLLTLDLRLRGVPVAGIYWYDFKQDEVDYDYEANFGIVSKDTARLRPAFLAYRRIAEAFGDIGSLAAINLPVSFSVAPEKIKSLSWSRGGSYVIGFWRMNQLQKRDVDFASMVSLKVPADQRVVSVELTDLNEDRSRQIGFRVNADNTLEVPLWVTARAGWIQVTVAAREPETAAVTKS